METNKYSSRSVLGLTLAGLGLLTGRRDFGLGRQQQLVRVIFLLLFLVQGLASVVCTTVCKHGLHRTDEVSERTNHQLCVLDVEESVSVCKVK